MRRVRVSLIVLAFGPFVIGIVGGGQAIGQTKNGATICVKRAESLQYPDVARIAHVDGSVLIRLHIADDGHVASVEKLKGPDILVQAAEANALTWLFKKGVATELDIRYDFVIGPPTNSTNPTTRVRFDFPDRVQVSAPGIPRIAD